MDDWNENNEYNGNNDIRESAGFSGNDVQNESNPFNESGSAGRNDVQNESNHFNENHRYSNNSANPFIQPQPQTRTRTVKQASYSRKEKRTPGFGTRLAKATVIALVFGLVAGTAFTGVNYFAGNALGMNKEAEVAPKPSEKKEENKEPIASTSIATPTSANLTVGTITTLDVSGVVENVMPSIVAITNTGSKTVQDWFGQKQTRQTSSAGSGIIVKQDNDYLYIVSNNHVVEGADSLMIQFSDGSNVAGEVKGTDPAHDLAVVKVALSDIESKTRSVIKVAVIGDSTILKVGEGTIAIGNALGYGQSVTTGVVSALGRTVSTRDDATGTVITNDNLIQTNAAINPGNSGGALLNNAGEVIGINSVKYSDTSVEGIGYAIAMEDAKPIIEQLITREKVEEAKQAFLGIQGQDITADIAKRYNMPEGVYVFEAIKGGAAEAAGIQQSDVITSLDGQKVSSMDGLKELLTYYQAGQEVKITVCSRTDNYKEKEITIKLGGK